MEGGVSPPGLCLYLLERAKTLMRNLSQGSQFRDSYSNHHIVTYSQMRFIHILMKSSLRLVS